MAMASNLPPQKPEDPSSQPQTESLHKWTVKALQNYLRARGLTYSGMREAELVAKLFATSLV